MIESKPFNIILSEIIKRKRKSVPDVLLTGKRVDSSSNKYHTICIHRTLKEKKEFKFSKCGLINFKDYATELVYLKLFIKNIDTDFTKSTAIIKITDLESNIFYMYIKLYIKSRHQSCDDLKYRIVYSSSFDDLINYIYKIKEIPNFLNSQAFVSKKDEKIDQLTILKEYDESCIKNVKYSVKVKELVLRTPPLEGLETLSENDETINININSKTSTITAITSKNKYSTRYKPRHEIFVNEIFTKGSDTIFVNISISNDGVDIYIKNNIETLKSFWLSPPPEEGSKALKEE